MPCSANTHGRYTKYVAVTVMLWGLYGGPRDGVS